MGAKERRSAKRARRTSSEASSTYLGNGTEAGLEAAVARAGSSSRSSGPAAAAAQSSEHAATAADCAEFYNAGFPPEECLEINGAVLEEDVDDEAEDHGPHVSDSSGSDGE
jgi:hypothetical protein